MTFSLTCRVPDCGKRTEGTTGLCGTHNKAMRKIVTTPIRKIGEKLQKKLGAYEERRRAFLYNKRCAVYPALKASQVHHKKGRIGNLLLDEKYWLPVSAKAHVEITNNPRWAIKMGYSLPRLDKPTETI